ncbi:MAG: succinate--CoA ligase subunit alpha [Candidatus Nanohaloarchaea archaeon]
MSILVDGDTKVLVQGITGREASEKVPEMIEYGTDVAAGVTPGKGGQEVAGVPVYDTVREALSEHPGINASLVYVPPFAAKDAAFEALENGIPLLNIITERVPTKDAWEIHRKAEQKNARVVGPTSVGIVTPGECKLGPIGGSEPGKVYEPGKVGVISKSGGMTTETSWVVRQAGYGISTAAGLGGDVIAGTTFADALEMFEDDPETEAVVMFGELGGTYEEKAAELLENGDFTKPLVAFIAGRFTENLPGKKYGHAGAIIRGERGTPSGKVKALEDAGAHMVDVHHEICEKLEDLL